MAPRSGYGTRFTKDYFSSQKHGRGRVAAARFGPPLQRARADPGRPARVLIAGPRLAGTMRPLAPRSAFGSTAAGPLLEAPREFPRDASA